jgi:hypothetical protein
MTDKSVPAVKSDRVEKRGGYSGSAPKSLPKPPSGPGAGVNPKPASSASKSKA